MKRSTLLAPVSLVAATILFAVTLPFTDIFVAGLLHAFAEAAMIGGLADWFAVVALFRHPFGLPIPHTAIIPKHRAKLTQGITDMVQNRWLTKETILERLAAWRVSSSLLALFDDEQNLKDVMQVLRSTLAEALRDIDDAQVARKLLDVLRTHVSTDDLLRWLRLLGERGVDGGWHHVFFTHAVGQAAAWLENREIRHVIETQLRRIAEDYADNPLRRLGKWMAESTNTLNYDDLTNAIITTLTEELRRMQRDKTHPARGDFSAWLQGTVDGLEENSELREQVDRLRTDLFERDDAARQLLRPVSSARSWVLNDLASESSVIMQQIEVLITRTRDRFSSNPEAQERVDAWVRMKLAELVERHHGEIGAIVERNLARLDDEQLVRQIEEKVGSDLQFIRVNGAVVGGLVGAVIYLSKYLLS